MERNNVDKKARPKAGSKIPPEGAHGKKSEKSKRQSSRKRSTRPGRERKQKGRKSKSGSLDKLASGTTKDRKSKGNKSTEKGQADLTPVDLRPEITIKYHCSDEAKNLLSRLVSSVRFRYTNELTRRVDLVFEINNLQAYNQVIKMIQTPCTLFGLPRLGDYKTGMHLNVFERDVDTLMEYSEITGIHGWTHCQCPKADTLCQHARTSNKELVWFHTIYHFKPLTVARLLLETTTRTGYSVHFEMSKQFGGYYKHDGDYEFKYLTRSTNGVDQISTSLAGCKFNKLLPSSNWLIGRNAVGVRVNGTNYVLGWKRLEADNEGCLILVKFRLFSQDVVNADVVLPYEEIEAEETTIEKKFEDLDDSTTYNIKIDKDYQLWDGKEFLRLSKKGTRVTKDIMIPTNMLTSGVRHLSGHLINTKSVGELESVYKSASKVSRYKEVNAGLSSKDLVDVIPILKVVAIKKVIANHNRIKGFFTASNKEIIDDYNKTIKFDNWVTPFSWDFLLVIPFMIAAILSFYYPEVMGYVLLGGLATALTGLIAYKWRSIWRWLQPMRNLKSLAALFFIPGISSFEVAHRYDWVRPKMSMWRKMKCKLTNANTWPVYFTHPYVEIHREWAHRPDVLDSHWGVCVHYAKYGGSYGFMAWIPTIERILIFAGIIASLSFIVYVNWDLIPRIVRRTIRQIWRLIVWITIVPRYLFRPVTRIIFYSIGPLFRAIVFLLHLFLDYVAWVLNWATAELLPAPPPRRPNTGMEVVQEGDAFSRYLSRAVGGIPKKVLLCGLVGGVKCYECTVEETVSYIVPVIWLAFGMLAMYIFSRVTKQVVQKYRGWDSYKGHVETERRTYSVTSFPIRPGDGIRAFECTTRADIWKQNLDCKFQVLEEKDEPVKRKLAAIAVGACFDTAAPHVDVNSQRTLEVSIKARATLEVGAERDPEKMEGINFSSELLADVEVGDDGYPTTNIPEFSFAGKKFKQKKTPTFEEYKARFPPRKRTLLEKASEKFKNGLFVITQFAYSVFNKKEKECIINKDEFPEDRRPRIISACSQFAKLFSGVWFLAYSNALKMAWNMLGLIWFSSGYTTLIFNYWFTYHSNRLGGVRNLFFVGTDFGKYDLTQGYAAIFMENEYYKSLGFCEVVNFGVALLASKLKSVCYGMGFKYITSGIRKSGDNDTSSGNSKLTGFVIYGFLITFAKGNCKQWLYKNCAISVLGDDNFLMLTRDFFYRIVTILRSSIYTCNLIGLLDPAKGTDYQVFEKGMAAFAAKYGFRLKIQISQNCSQVEYLSCRFYRIKGVDGLTHAIGKKPGRVLVKLGWMMAKAGRSTQVYLENFVGTLMSYRATANHVPFLRVYIAVMLEHLKTVSPKFDEDVVKYMLKGEEEESYEACSDTWADFTETYGLDSVDEKLFEIGLRDGLKRHGLPFMMNSRCVEIMYRIDAEM